MLREAGLLWDIITFANRRRFFVVMGLLVTMALLESAGVLSVTPFLAVLGDQGLVARHPLMTWLSDAFGVSGARETLVMLGALSILVVVSAALFKSVSLHLLNRYVQFHRYHISTHLLKTYLAQPYTFHLQRNSSDLAKSMLSEVDHLIGNVLQPFMVMLAHGIVILAMVALLLAYDASMALVVVTCVSAFYGAIYFVVRGVLDRAGFERHASNSRRFRACSEVLGGVKEVKAMDAYALFTTRFAEATRQFSRHAATCDTLSQTPLYFAECLGFSVIVGLTVFLVARGNDLGQILPALGLYAFAAYRMLPAAQIVYRGATRLRSGGAALRFLHEELSLAGRHELQAVSEIVSSEPLRLTKAISVRNVSYSYSNSGRGPSLLGLELDIKANTTVGIIGSTGAGKSTLIDVLLGLLAPDEGEVWIDDVLLTPERASAWRASVGYVPQQIFLTDSTIAENIAFGVPADRIDMMRVERAARSAQLHDFICERLPLGYKSVVGERGVRLSGGERQRLGLARALYREPSVLLLDEATSALDIATESSVLSSINGLKGTRTIIMVAHRLSTVEACDSVILLEQGKVAMIGSPNDVIAHAKRLWYSDRGAREPNSDASLTA